MIKINDGRNDFYQWDLNRKVSVNDTTTTEIHFSNKMSETALVVEVVDGIANVPNILLQEAWPIKAYAYCGTCYTKDCATFKVNARTKPADYVYTETEVKSWDALEEEVKTSLAELETIVNNIPNYDDEVLYLEGKVLNHDIRITQIENHINPKYFITDESAAYNKNIPNNACPYVELNNVGSNYISSVKATNNLFNPSDLGWEVNEDGYIYSPGGRASDYVRVDVEPNNFYTISSGIPVGIVNGEESISPENNITFYSMTDYVDIFVAGDVGGNEEPQWFSIMMNEGIEALPFEPYREGRKAEAGKYCDNLISFPYYNSSTTINGISFTVNNDGTLTLNGTNTATGNATIHLLTNSRFSLEPGTYTMAGTGSENVVFRISDGIEAKDAKSTNLTFTINENTKYNVFVYVRPGTTLNNFIVKPMINKGTTALPFEPYYAGTKSTKITAIEHYGANLVNDEAIFRELGFTKQANGYWLGSHSSKYIFANTDVRAGSLSISYYGRCVELPYNQTPCCFRIIYTDGSSEWQAILTPATTTHSFIKYTTPANKTVLEIQFAYGNFGTFEIKDLMINWGSIINYQPYSAEPIFTYEIPEAIQKLTGYGFGTIDFENKKFIQYDGFVGDNPPDRAEHDISAALADFDNIWEVQAGGTLRFVNEAKAAIPSSFTYLAKEDSV